MSVSGGRWRRVIEWAWQSARLREATPEHRSEQDAALLGEARGAALMAWRLLAGLEPVARELRAPLALPLLVSGLETVSRVVAPERASFAELLDDAVWQARLTEANLPAPEQAALKSWLQAPSRETGTPAIAQSALVALRAALYSTGSPERTRRAVLLRRLFVVVTLLALLVGSGFGVASLLRGPEMPDVAVGRPWKASSNYPGFNLEGTKPQRPIDGLFFSTNEEESPWWRVDLQRSHTIAAVTVVNRSDCCPERAYPLALELSHDGQTFREVARQTDSFSTWRATFAPTAARYVRLRALKRTLLHFKDVRVHVAVARKPGS